MPIICHGGIVQFQASPCGICSGQSVNGTQFSVGIIPPIFLTHFIHLLLMPFIMLAVDSVIK